MNLGTEDAWKINIFWNVETRPHTSTLDLEKKNQSPSFMSV